MMTAPCFARRSFGGVFLRPCLALNFFAALSAPLVAMETNLDQQWPGFFSSSGDVGAPAIAGGAAYDPSEQTYELRGAGANMWAGEDQFQFLYRAIEGDFIATAQVRFVGEGVDPHRKIGWIARNSLEADSAHANACVHGDGLTSLQYRTETGAETEQAVAESVAPDVIRLERRGDRLLMSVARFGEPFETVEISHPGLDKELLVGLYVCSHNAAVSESAVFSNVRITIPAGPDLQPYRDYLGSRLETLDVATGQRRIVFSTPEGIEAPNWTPDGRTLIYNSQGQLFRFDLATGAPSPLDTGFAQRNNNDHVLSFDGAVLGISHHSADHGGKSIIYRLPASGGEPTQITSQGPSYLHGWSPDGQHVIYTAERDGDYEIYRSRADGSGGETRLTRSPGLDDGSEYAPDGSKIYFNSTRSGRMQIWRMNPDGSDAEQLTHDDSNNWFPHVSPDGTTIVYLAFGPEVRPDDHPYYQRVTLRSMPAEGGPSRVIAYLYGGQGTINVPSWSPDSKRVAFVSHTGF